MLVRERVYNTCLKTAQVGSVAYSIRMYVWIRTLVDTFVHNRKHMSMSVDPELKSPMYHMYILWTRKHGARIFTPELYLPRHLRMEQYLGT